MLRYAKICAATLAAGAMIWGGVAIAQNHHPGNAESHERMMKMAAVTLGLSDAQKETFHATMQKAMTEASPLLKRKTELRQALKASIEAGKTDTATIQPIADETGRIESQLVLLHAKAIGEVLGSLTPEQREKAKQLHDLF